jgi:regulator of extracellular matrix RemA (YlzA/DUF370 family)
MLCGAMATALQAPESGDIGRVTRDLLNLNEATWDMDTRAVIVTHIMCAPVTPISHACAAGLCLARIP